MEYLLVLILVVLNLLFYVFGYWAGYDRCSRSGHRSRLSNENDSWIDDADWWKR